MDISHNLKSITSALPTNTTLVAVSKTKPHEMIMEAYENGQKDFGENKVQDLTDKHLALPKDIRWHFIGHLQTNKVKYIAPFVYLIHGIDSLKLLRTVNKEGEKNQRTISCLLQIKISSEESKFGLSQSDTKDILNSDEFKSFNNIEIKGLMGMASNTSDTIQISKEFNSLKSFFDTLKSTHFKCHKTFEILSMGMSSDYLIAVDAGSTMIRIGSAIFGARQYKP